ncbi:MAG TPA: DUF899 domain-containing protein, partial [Streptosporangiaceae bacterium]|nr:DUF899 domain-containing protein [Streptosporangiaceae bacterium]
DRRRLPMVKVDQEYVFEGPDGQVSLADLFGGRRQLIVQHVMFGPDWEQPCPGCSASLAELSQGMLDHLATRETTFVLTSRAPYDKIAAKAKERGWSFPWYSSFGSEFNYDYQVTLDADRGLVDYNYRPVPQAVSGERSTELPGYSCFLREGDDVFHTYSTYERGADHTIGTYAFLDLTALGRQEDWEEPKGRVAPVRGGDPTFSS